MLATPTLSSESLGPGTRLGRYEILLGVAQGGMARVWAAKQHGQRGFSKVVAIKTILPHLAMDPQFETMFLDEARVAAGVHHPNVCEIFDLGEESGVLYLAMEWVEGESLSRVLKPGSGVEGALPQALNPRFAAKIISEAAGGLHAAHDLSDDMGQRLNVVHRDVSPQNILVGLNGAVKVTDFGVAKALGQLSEQTMAGQIKGKAPYMSPEQARGKAVDRRSDVFALGICLYEATTGKRPFFAKGGNQVAIIKQVLSGKFEPPSAHVPGYPRELEAIVLKAMAFDPFQRFATADRMKHALEEWIAQSGSIVTQTQVGQEVRNRVGYIIDDRQGRIKTAMRQASESGVVSTSPSPLSAPAAHMPPSSGSFPGSAGHSGDSSSRISAPSSVSGAGVSSGGIGPHTRTQPGRRSPRQASAVGTALMGVGIGIGAFVVIGGLAFGGWYLFGNRQAPSAPATAAATAQPAAAAPAATGYIVLRSVPKTQVRYTLDGKKLASGVTRVPRPPPGTTRVLKAEAQGFATQTIRLDAETPDYVDVILEDTALDLDSLPVEQKEAPADEPPKQEQPRAEAPRDTTPSPAPRTKPKPKPKPKPTKVDIPDNPFD